MKMTRLKKTLSLALVTSTILASGTSSLAAVEAYIAEVDGVKYEFNRDALMDSILDRIMGKESPMYDKYLRGNLVALRDDKRGIVDIKSVENYILDSIISGKEFDIDSFTETSEDAEIIEIEDVKEVSLEGEVIEEPEELAPVLVYEGETEVDVDFGADFEVPEVQVKGDRDVEITSAITFDGENVETVNTRVSGVYTIVYSAVDSLGNRSEDLVITVTVAERTMKLEITQAGVLPGMNSVSVTLPVPDPENYTVTIGGRTLSFKAETETFIGVANAGVTVEDVEYSLK